MVTVTIVELVVVVMVMCTLPTRDAPLFHQFILGEGKEGEEE